MTRRNGAGLALVAAAAWLGAAAASAQTGPGVSASEVRLGSWQPLSGPVSIYGVPVRAGADAYFNLVNEQGGIKGRKIKFIVEDNAFNPQRTVAAARKLIGSDEVLAIAVAFGTGPSAAAFPYVLQQEKTPFVTPYAGAEEWFAPPRPGLLSAQVLYENQAATVGRWAVKDDRKSILVIHSDPAAYHKPGEAAVAAIRKANPSAKVEALSVKWGTQDYAPIALDVLRRAPDAVIQIAVVQEVASLAKELRQQNSQVPIYTYSPNVTQSLPLLGGPAVEGIKSVSWTVPATLDNPALREYRAALAKYAPDQKPDFDSLLSFGFAKIVAEALRRADEPLNRTSFLEGFYKLKGYDTGILPPVTFAPDKPLGLSTLQRVVLKSGIWEAVGEPVDSTAEW
ncbi:ABC transporter substrate-binding protein [Bosea sp. SSUT16]|jgi:ABC-type branched-subunit amino acid transport system substrate-binding protein|uniref:ABC transporter substrate-binding protein n=1 Tax=Bosea spartocytisi TaxID=2773451 RepID=A0A927EDM2_9HYPH|nr:ABC transporter substrate-binding protein [Bosea spartocytisi]MBD3848090.1 ABC transporter substrate-binding protein [Bosea spartocytisi]MCT4473941.1 ABC transporter substrate-binding protein [Bosea spartocytisi]